MSEFRTFPKKLPDMPKAGWKDSFDAFKLKDNREKKVSEKKPPKEIKKTPIKPSQKPIKRTPIKKIGARTKKRESESGKESDMYLRKWEAVGGLKGAVFCACGCKKTVDQPFIWDTEKEKYRLIKPQCFAHILAKGMYPKLRYLLENIAVVANTKCHKKIDEQWNDLEKRRIKEQELLQLL